jgi:hypothetical protein
MQDNIFYSQIGQDEYYIKNIINYKKMDIMLMLEHIMELNYQTHIIWKKIWIGTVFALKQILIYLINYV